MDSTMIAQDREQLAQLRVATAKSFLKSAIRNSNQMHVEKMLMEACEMLEQWSMEFDMFYKTSATAPVAPDGTSCQPENPFSNLLAQTRHKLGQLSLLKGNLANAAHLFLRVALFTPHALSTQALALTLYDVGIIYMKYGSLSEAEEFLRQSYSVAMKLHSSNIQPDITHLQQLRNAMVCLVQLRQQKQSNGSSSSSSHSVDADLDRLPWSHQFSIVSYNFVEDEVPGFWENCSAMDPSVMAAGAA